MFSRKLSGIDCACAICSAVTGVAGRGELDRRADGVVGLRGGAHGRHYPRCRGRAPADRRLPLRRRPLRDRPSRSLAVGYCHCTRCQRRTGTAASAQARVAPGSLRIVAGRGARPCVGAADDGFAKCFCSGCGGALWSREPDDGEVWASGWGRSTPIPASRPSYRQYVAYAAPWEPIPDDGLERYPRGQRPSAAPRSDQRARCRAQPAQHAARAAPRAG